jgi:F0F1-type ATP synthase assembly protein I
LRLDAELLKKTGIFGLVSGELIGSVGCGYWIGGWLDKRLNTAPVFLNLLVFAGFSYSIWRIYKVSKRWMEK